MAKIRFTKGKQTGMVIKMTEKDKSTQYQKATAEDIPNMSSAAKVKFATRAKQQKRKVGK
jgi:hypothetical protein